MSPSVIWGLVPKWAIAVALAAVIAHDCSVVVQRNSARAEFTKTQNTLYQERTARAAEDKQRAEVARAAEQEFRRMERQRVEMAQEIANDLSKSQRARDAARVTELADHQRVLSDVEAFLAAGSGGGAETCPADLAAERNRSSTLGRLFQEADGLAGEMADAAERHADEARALKRQVITDRQPPGEQK
jgi:hypothetical protein